MRVPLAELPLDELLHAARGCTHCSEHLPLGPNPIVRASEHCEVVLVSQAPGRIAHLSGVPYQDPSGRRLREWLDVTEEEFYESGVFAILPMGFCFPGKRGRGDAPPRPECAPLWHEHFWRALPQVRLKVLLGAYAQNAYLPDTAHKTLTERVRHHAELWPEWLPLPHPSPLPSSTPRANARFCRSDRVS